MISYCCRHHSHSPIVVVTILACLWLVTIVSANVEHRTTISSISTWQPRFSFPSLPWGVQAATTLRHSKPSRSCSIPFLLDLDDDDDLESIISEKNHQEASDSDADFAFFRPQNEWEQWQMREATFAVRDLPQHKTPQTELEYLEAACRPGSRIR